MSRAAVDIGTNSIRLLIVDDDGSEVTRIQRVTGLGRGVDATGRFDGEAVRRTIDVLEGFGEAMKSVTSKRAVATSASRDASDREAFLDLAEQALGVRPEVIAGTEEAALSYAGATEGMRGDLVVVDIGGGSTEFVWKEDGELHASSFDMGSVRITERHLQFRPSPFEAVETAARTCQEAFAPVVGLAGRFEAIGVAGTWTSLAGLVLESADRSAIHGFTLDRTGVDRLVVRLAALTIADTAALAGLDPARAPVILGGAVVAREAMRALGVDRLAVSERDLLDGVVAGLGP